MIPIVGLARSGTSVMMQILRAAYGPESAIGDKWPHDKRTYWNTDRRMLARELCPGGYWETNWAYVGVPVEVAKEIRADGRHRFIKLMSDGLKRTDASNVHCAIFVTRHLGDVWRSVRRYAERLGEPGMAWVDASWPEFARSSLADARDWAHFNKRIEILHVPYEHLVAAPDIVVPNILDFIHRFSGMVESSCPSHLVRRSPLADAIIQESAFSREGFHWGGIR